MISPPKDVDIWIVPDSTGLCGRVQPSHGYSNESVLESVEKLNRAIELRDICKYKTPFYYNSATKMQFSPTCSMKTTKSGRIRNISSFRLRAQSELQPQDREELLREVQLGCGFDVWGQEVC